MQSFLRIPVSFHYLVHSSAFFLLPAASPRLPHFSACFFPGWPSPRPAPPNRPRHLHPQAPLEVQGLPHPGLRVDPIFLLFPSTPSFFPLPIHSTPFLPLPLCHHALPTPPPLPSPPPRPPSFLPPPPTPLFLPFTFTFYTIPSLPFCPLSPPPPLPCPCLRLLPSLSTLLPVSFTHSSKILPLSSLPLFPFRSLFLVSGGLLFNCSTSRTFPASIALSWLFFWCFVRVLLMPSSLLSLLSLVLLHSAISFFSHFPSIPLHSPQSLLALRLFVRALHSSFPPSTLARVSLPSSCRSLSALVAFLSLSL